MANLNAPVLRHNSNFYENSAIFQKRMKVFLIFPSKNWPNIVKLRSSYRDRGWSLESLEAKSFPLGIGAKSSWNNNFTKDFLISETCSILQVKFKWKNKLTQQFRTLSTKCAYFGYGSIMIRKAWKLFCSFAKNLNCNLIFMKFHSKFWVDNLFI